LKIISIVRTLDEELNIRDFCESHQWADLILVADGGSADATKEIALAYSNVKVRDFKRRIQIGGYWSNPEPDHLNFLIDWAKEEGADWILWDDCDSRPTRHLQQDIRRLLEESGKSLVMLKRLYVWTDETMYFPKINEAGPCVWGWNPARVEMYWPKYEGLTLFDTQGPVPDISQALILESPYADLHYFMHNREKKMERYAAWGQPQLPLEQSGYWPPEQLPEWAKWR
jgi:glycosyltransferase involved in cell wall biosynthesis